MIVVFFLLAAVQAIYLGWPLNEQLPNVARVNEPYQFTIADLTYRSNAGGTVAYSVENTPSWLHFDLSSRTFSGTPSLLDTGSFQITLNGVDSKDSSKMSNQYTMLVLDSSGIQLSSPDVMFTSVAKYGNTNGRGGLVLREGEDFSITFSKDVFEQKNDSLRPIIAYYGRSEDRTSLPNWINFDLNSLSFSGTVPKMPSDIAPSFEYGFSFLASDYYGYSGAEGIFKILVGAHELSTSLNELIKINGTFDSDFHVSVPILLKVFLDGSPIDRSNISSVETTDLPDYAHFDQDKYTISGVFPNSSRFDNFSVSVNDHFGNSVELPYHFESFGSVFTVNSLPDVNATQGEFFQYQLMKLIFTDLNDTTIDVQLGDNSSWLSYHSSNMTLLGKVPSHFQKTSVKVNAKSAFDSELHLFSVLGVLSHHKSSSSSTSSSATSTPSASSTLAAASASTTAAALNHKEKLSNRKGLIIGLSVGLPVFFVLLAALLLFLCCFRRRNNKSDEENEKVTPAGAGATGSREELTGPGFGESHENDEEQAHKLGALNALKLDDDQASTLLSLTHVESTDNEFFDASEKPMKSWRAQDASDLTAIKQKLQEKHQSEISTSTVNTDELFSVRLVDDEFRRALLQQLLRLAMMRDSWSTESLNIQRLDSDGNIAETPTPKSPKSPISPQKRILHSSLLNNIAEESHNTSGDTTETFYSNANGSSSLVIHKDTTHRLLDPLRHPQMYMNSPTSETFLLQGELTPVNNARSAAEASLSHSSVYSNDQNHGILGNNADLGSQAKLVEFTRKGSLRQSAHTPTMEYPEESAAIHEGDSD